MSDIAINPVTRRVQFTGNTGTGPYAFNFNILQSSDIVVYKNNVLLTETTDYTVSIAANGTGNITLTAALVLTDILTIIGGRELSRTTDFVTAGDLLASSLNEQLDSNVIMSQQLDERFGRTIKAQPGDEDATLDLPTVANRANKIILFDTSGNVTAASATDFFTNSVLGGNYIVNTATGDGSQTAFGLTVAPGVATNIQIHIDGVYQNKATFSLSGSTVTFSEAPPLNSSIEFIIGQAVTQITGNASAITYNQGGTGAQDRTVQSKLQDFVSVKDFGAVGDGVADDTDALIAAHNTGKNVMYVAGEKYLVTPSIGSYTKYIPVYEGQIIEGNNCEILCTNGGRTVFLIAARPNDMTPRRHLSNIKIQNFRIASNKTTNTFVANAALDFEYFITVRGGYVMTSSFTNIAASNTSSYSNPSATAIVYFDLNDPQGEPTVGVPDGITINDFYFLGAYGVSSHVLIDGSSAGVDAPFGNLTMNNHYLGNINPVDYDNRANSTGKHGVLIIDTASIDLPNINGLFGGARTVCLFNASYIRTGKISNLYNELSSPQSSGNNMVLFSDATSYIENVAIASPQIYAIGSAFSPSYNYNLIDVTAYNCQITNPYIYENDTLPSQVPADLIKLGSTSYGNEIDHIDFSGLVTNFNNKSDLTQTFITAPKSNSIKSWVQPYKEQKKNISISSGNTLVFAVPAGSVEFRDTYRYRVVVEGTSGDVKIFASVSVSLESATTTLSVSNNIHVIEGTLFFDSTSIGTTASAALNGSFVTVHNGATATAHPANGTYTRAANLEFYINLSAGSATILHASIETERGTFATLT